jgi:hypothetical protein
MLLWDAIARRDSWAKLSNVSSTALASLLFGMMGVFGWRVLHGGIGVIFAIAIVGAIVNGLAVRRARKQAEAPSKSG